MLNSKNELLSLNKLLINEFVYLKAYSNINLDELEYDPIFFINTFTEETITRFLNCYLSLLDNNNKERFELIKKDTDLEPRKILDLFLEDLKTNYQETVPIIHFIRKEILEKYKENTTKQNEFDAAVESTKPENPLDQLMNFGILNMIFSALKFNYSEKILFTLVLLNTVVPWIFPPNKDDLYKSKIFAQVANKETEDCLGFGKKVNKKIIDLGLFCKDWTLSYHIAAFFSDEHTECSSHRIFYKPNHDLYDYEQMEKENINDFTIFLKLVKSGLKNQQTTFLSIQENDEFRQKNFLSYVLSKNHVFLYELDWNNNLFNSDELCFQIFIQSLLLQKKYVLFVNNEEAEKLFEQDNEKTNLNLLKFVTSPVIFGFSKASNFDSKKLEDFGIDILFDWNFLYSKELNLKDVFVNFFFEKKIKDEHLKILVDKCSKYKITPGKWDSIAEFAQKTESLSKEEFEKVFEQKFSVHDENTLANPNYSLSALNTSENIEQIVEYLKNADEFQKGQYDENSGIRCKNSGPSGTGKTQFAKMVAYYMHKPLITVSASEVLGCYVGETEKNTRRVFEQAKKERAILLIDEADSFLHARGDSVNRHNDSKVNEFLVQMEKFPGILFCNTNLPDSFDKATDRRFHFKIEFNYLTKEGIKDLCSSYFGEYDFSDTEIQEIFDSGSVAPGDFGILSSKMRFISKDQRNKNYVLAELKKIVQSKTRSYENKQIGFRN